MQITLEIPDHVAAKAAVLGVSVEDYVREVLTRETAASHPATLLKTREERQAWLDELAQFSDGIPELPDEALTRESFYQDHD